MKIVIDIPEKLIELAKNDMWVSTLGEAVKHGTPYEERPSGEWIPCSKRLPEEIGDYLVTEHLSDIAQAVYVSSFGHVRTGELCFYYEDDDGRAITNNGIVAWMPLPEPYKGEH